MSRPRPFALLILCGAVILAAACAGESSAPGAAALETTAANGALPERGGPMPAGRYATEEFEPSFSFEVGEGWGLILAEMPDAVGIGTAPDEGVLFHRPKEVVFDPGKPRLMEKVDAPENADEWVSWFVEHPHLETSKPEPVTIGGVSGVQIDTEPSSVPKDYSQECGNLAPCVPLYPFGETDVMASYLGYPDRFVVLDVDGGVVLIDIAAPSEDFEKFARSAQEVLKTVAWQDAP